MWLPPEKILPSSRRIVARRKRCHLCLELQISILKFLGSKVWSGHRPCQGLAITPPLLHPKGRIPAARPETATRAESFPSTRKSKRNSFSLNGGAKLGSEHRLVSRVLKVYPKPPLIKGSHVLWRTWSAWRNEVLVKTWNLKSLSILPSIACRISEIVFLISNLNENLAPDNLISLHQTL